MKIEQNTIKRTTINISEVEIMQNLKVSYSDAIADSNPKELVQVTQEFARASKLLVSHDFVSLFREGMTMLMLPAEAYPVIDEFFVNKKQHGACTAGTNELEILIHCEHQVITVKESDIEY